MDALLIWRKGFEGREAKRPVDGLPAPGSAAERLRSAKRKQPVGEAENPTFSATKEHPNGCSFDIFTLLF